MILYGIRTFLCRTITWARPGQNNSTANITYKISLQIWEFVVELWGNAESGQEKLQWSWNVGHSIYVTYKRINLERSL